MSPAIQYPDLASYLAAIPEERLAVFNKLRATINENLDKKFEECLSYNMLGWVVPKSIYPEGYHCNTELPLPFANLANQKGFIAFYHMGVYADKQLYDWFVAEYPKHCKYKLNMGKSCIRFKGFSDIPYELVGELVRRMDMAQWINLYEKNVKSK